MRLFLAIELEEAVRDSLTALQGRLKETGADVRWVEPGNFHLTVKFIGDQPDTLLPEIEAVCADVAGTTAGFGFAVRGAGAFPKRGPLKTIWVGLSGEGVDAWKALTLRAQEPLAAFGVAREGGLVPHITLGRVKSGTGMDNLRAALAAEATADCGAQAARQITLMKSMLDPRGAIHTPLRHFELGT